MSTKDNKAGLNPEADKPVVKELDSPANRQKKKEEEKKKKLQDINLRIDRSNLSDDTKKLAKNALESDDQDEIALVEQLLSRSIVMTQDEFAKKLQAIREKKAKIKKGEVLPSIETNLKVKNTVFSKLSSTEIPGNKKAVNEKIKAKGKVIEKLNAEHGKSVQEVMDILKPFITDKKISEEDAQKIAQFDPNNTAKFQEKFPILLGKLSSNKMLVERILRVKENQKKLIDKFENALIEVKEMVENEAKDYYTEKEKFEKLRRLSAATGINIFEGQELEYMGLSNDLQRFQQKLRINTLKYERQDSLADNPPSDLSDIDIKELEDEALNLPKVLKISVSIDNPDGRTETIQMNEAEFIKFIDAKEATKIINSPEELNQEIGFAEFEQSLEPGMELEYSNGMQSDGLKLYDKVKIEKIDKAKGKITLDQPIIVTSYSNGAEYGQATNRVKKEVTFGEFSKWFHKFKAEEKMPLDKVRKIVKQMPHVLKLRYPNADPGVVVFNDLPIEIKKGEKLKYGDKKESKIEDVTEDEITLSTGEKFTPGQFLRFVKDNEVEKLEKIKIPDDIMNQIENTLDTKKEKAKLANGEPDDSEGKGTPSDDGDKIGPLGEIWAGITFLTIKDIMKVIDTSKEFFKRRFERNSKRRAAATGSNLPGRLGSEFKNLTQTAENEEVTKYTGDMEQNGVWYIQGRMRETMSPDEFKACIILLTQKASYNFYDGRNWEDLNRILGVMKSPQEADALRINFKKDTTVFGADRYIPLKNAQGDYPVEAAKAMMSALWGEPGGSDWYKQNDDAYNGNVGKFTKEAADLEADPQNSGGAAGALHDMLVQHLKGNYVEPYRYEAFLKMMINMGKAEYEDKVYYLYAGLAAVNPKSGETLLNGQRLSALDNDHMNQLPHLDFFTRFKNEVGDEDKNSPNYKVVMDTEYVTAKWKEMSKDYGLKNTKIPSKKDRYNYFGARRHLWEDVMTHGSVLWRASKAIRNAQNMDHDDAHGLIPMVDEEQIEKEVLSNNAGRPVFTAPGKANGVAGYTQYMKSLAVNTMRSPEEITQRKAKGYTDPVELMRKTFKSWLYFEGQVTGRVSFDPSYARLSDEQINKTPLVDSDKTVRAHADEMREVLRKVLLAYGMKEKDVYDYLDFASTTLKEDNVKKAHLSKIKTFPKTFDKLIASDNGAKMVNIVQSCLKDGSLEGFKGDSQKVEKKEEGNEDQEKEDDVIAKARTKKQDIDLNNGGEIDLQKLLQQSRDQANNASKQ